MLVELYGSLPAYMYRASREKLKAQDGRAALWQRQLKSISSPMPSRQPRDMHVDDDVRLAYRSPKEASSRSMKVGSSGGAECGRAVEACFELQIGDAGDGELANIIWAQIACLETSKTPRRSILRSNSKQSS